MEYLKKILGSCKTQEVFLDSFRSMVGSLGFPRSRSSLSFSMKLSGSSPVSPLNLNLAIFGNSQRWLLVELYSR